MKQFKLLGVFVFLIFTKSFAKNVRDTTDVPTYKIAVFAPLYLDSLFNNGNLRYKEGIPKFASPAVEFVQGIEAALDSLKLTGAKVQVYIYDSKSYIKNINYLIKNKKLDSIHLIIGSVKDYDYKLLADFALKNKIPFVSATYPNDGGITANPYTIIMNSTLKAHCEGIYSNLLQNFPTDKLLLIRKKGAQEDKIAMYFKNINEQEGSPLLNLQTLMIDSTFSDVQLAKTLDSNRKTVIIAGGLDEGFAKAITNAAFELQPNYPITLIGMPNWDGFGWLKKKDEYTDFPIYFTTPYYNTKWDNYSKQLKANYQKKYRTTPSDMAYKGFEAVLLFTNILIKHPADVMGNVNDKTAKVFCDYNFKPVKNNAQNVTSDYYENKHLYFIKILNGATGKAW